ncbi:hypothetical protein [Spirosoma pollinicola]|uniref:Uncharacterized protein n=1 Tax=Spirosoma pollinicola TaxID=2057025 RepID=A0A2K8ZAL2_9BACT|nr:hypothetical protein [Spirosoma pollinicola]AUD06912.1 hypothetical protein CWM47_36780 [Spirosoma pollinicola]
MTHLSIAPSESSLSALIRAAEALLHLSSSDEVLDAYLSIQESMVDVLEAAPDPMAYSHAWNLISCQGQLDLLDSQNGNQEALLRLKQTVSQSVECLPR